MRRFVVLLFIVGAVAAATAQPAVAQTVVLRPPVDAPVLDPYRPPSSQFGSGNRGIEYDTASGTRVDAAGPGLIVFAGPVAGRAWVTVAHEGGLLTSYGPLTAISVDTGDVVVRGERIGSTTGPLHFSTRVDGEYVDPATVLGVREVTVRLVEHQTDDERHWLRLVEQEERRHLAEHAGGGGLWGVVDRALGLAMSAASPLFYELGGTFTDHVDQVVHLLELGHTLHDNLDIRTVIGRMVTGLAQIVDPNDCSGAAAIAALPVRPARRRIAIVIDGLGSSSEVSAMAGLDLEGLGYDPADIARVSYGGGLVPGGEGDWPVELSDYDGSMTRGDVEPQIDQVIDTVRAIAADNPGVAIDVYGHSLGGLIARHVLAATADEVDYGIAITLAAPHGGTPLADLVEAVEVTTAGTMAADLADDLGWDDMALIAPVIEDLSETGFAGDTSDVAFPDSVHAVTIGSRADVVVPATQAGAPGAAHVIVGGLDPLGAHSDIATFPEVEQEVRLALAGLPPACSGAADAILDLVVPETIAFAENALAASILVTEFSPS